VLPDGTELDLDAEAYGEDGAAGLGGEVTGGRDGESGTVGGEVARSTARRAVTDALGAGLVGGAAADALRAHERRPTPESSPRVVTVAPGTPMSVLILREVRTDIR
jgi:hypothetical protein